jgi:hypothetical protein
LSHDSCGCKKQREQKVTVAGHKKWGCERNGRLHDKCKSINNIQELLFTFSLVFIIFLTFIYTKEHISLLKKGEKVHGPAYPSRCLAQRQVGSLHVKQAISTHL